MRTNISHSKPHYFATFATSCKNIPSILLIQSSHALHVRFGGELILADSLNAWMLRRWRKNYWLLSGFRTTPEKGTNCRASLFANHSNIPSHCLRKCLSAVL